ncbi:MAG: glycosyltransferase family 4 protein [Burkholderiales bacterium]|nr:glycosyltransferase family 4 protein [Burkholderiales bacterium]
MKEECIVVTWLPPDQPGYLDFAYRIRALARTYRTIVVSPYPLQQPELAIEGVEPIVLAYDMGRVGWIRYLLASARFIRARRPACAVLLHSMLAPMTWLVRKTPTALYWNEHPSRFTASPPGHPFIKRLARKLALKFLFMDAAKRAAVVMPIGEAHRDDLLQMGCDPERVKLHYMGVDRAFLRDFPSPQRPIDAPLELVYNGTLNHLRGRDVMLEGVAIANRDGAIARLTIVGASQDQIDYCNDYAKQLGIDNALTVRGRVPGHEIPALLHGADLGLCFIADLPWWRFNPSTKLFECLAAGVPVVASDIRTHTAYLSNWYNGLICRYDSASLADGLRRLWERRNELEQMKQHASQSGQQYLWDRIEPEFLQTIASIAHPPKECVVITRFAPDQPGFLDFSYRMKALAKHYRLVVVSDFPLTQAELQVEGAEYVILPGGDGRKGWLNYLWHCGNFIRARRPHCAVLLHSSVAPVALLSGRVSTAVYWNEHPTHFAEASKNASPVKRAIRFISRWLAFQGARRASVVMPIGEAHSEDLLEHGCPPQRMRLIYMGVDPSFDSAALALPLEKQDAPLELIYVGTVSKARGRDVMLEALKIANGAGPIARLTLIGASDSERAYCREYAEQLGIADAVTVHGRIAGSAIPAHLRRADVGLCLWEDQPWWRFNPPTKLFEYLVAGLPVLASDIRTHTQYVRPGCNGLIFNYDSKSLACAIQTLWQQRSELQRMKRQARESGEPYLWDRIEPAFLQAVREVARP